MRLEYLLGRLSFQVDLARGAKDPKWSDILRYHERNEPEKQLTDSDISAEAFAAMFGARKKKE